MAKKDNTIWWVLGVIAVLVLLVGGGFGIFSILDKDSNELGNIEDADIIFEFDAIKDSSFTFSDGLTICNAFTTLEKNVVVNKEKVDFVLMMIENGSLDDDLNVKYVKFVKLEEGIYTCRIGLGDLTSEQKSVLNEFLMEN